MKKSQPILSFVLALLMLIGVVLTAQAAPGGNDTSQRLNQLEAQMGEVQAELAALRMALDVANLTEVQVTRYVEPGSMVSFSVFCPDGTTLRGRSWNIRGNINDLPKITNDHDKTDLSGVFIRAHGGVSNSAYLDVTAICGPEIVE